MKPWRLNLMLIRRLIILWLPVLVNVAFFTLLERKVLGLRQSRKGPNKVRWGGVLQPFADAIKLFSKENTIPSRRLKAIYFLAPIFSLVLALWIWRLLPSLAEEFDFSLALLLILIGLSLYPLLLAGWASHRTYATLGAMRGVAQTISYEIRLALLLISLFASLRSLNIQQLLSYSDWGALRWLLVIAFLWWITCLAETNRTPFDFAEGESELVSGFNIEYGAGGFALIFMAEYARILSFRVLTSLVTGFQGLLSRGGLFVRLVVGFAWVWARATLPRHRYDKLMDLAWKGILPLTLCSLRFYLYLYDNMRPNSTSGCSFTCNRRINFFSRPCAIDFNFHFKGSGMKISEGFC